MSRLDALPADQKSVLQLLLRQGKGYDDLSGLLRLDADEVSGADADLGLVVQNQLIAVQRPT